ncbi:hypothetical protein CEXT_268041 [Caerostris extrusa]|uniref:Uncharacterized protein n=1 Tax=Caerostris extrusa TaxID=172846 RepID=A0AAV4VKZ3_CAEEX|nr:hypothetical protein CEXT_268041 [Caerostris extrusa]
MKICGLYGSPDTGLHGAGAVPYLSSIFRIKLSPVHFLPDDLMKLRLSALGLKTDGHLCVVPFFVTLLPVPQCNTCVHRNQQLNTKICSSVTEANHQPVILLLTQMEPNVS